jgi:hypothetical protein
MLEGLRGLRKTVLKLEIQVQKNPKKKHSTQTRNIQMKS